MSQTKLGISVKARRQAKQQKREDWARRLNDPSCPIQQRFDIAVAWIRSFLDNQLDLLPLYQEAAGEISLDELADRLPEEKERYVLLRAKQEPDFLAGGLYSDTPIDHNLWSTLMTARAQIDEIDGETPEELELFFETNPSAPHKKPGPPKRHTRDELIEHCLAIGVGCGLTLYNNSLTSNPASAVAALKTATEKLRKSEHEHSKTLQAGWSEGTIARIARENRDSIQASATHGEVGQTRRTLTTR